ncbi:Crp/Fnr family transcriptional regulator [Lacinutrix chionoecetis]
MNLDLFKHVYKHASLTQNRQIEIATAHKKITITKGQYIFEAGKITNNYALVESGLFRSFVLDYDGNEITTGFYATNDILIEVSSLFQRTPSKENFEALTDGVIWNITLEDFQHLYQHLDGFSEWGRNWMSNQLFMAKNRSLDMLTLSATNRYLKLLEENPEIIKQAPLKHIASYLGVTDTSLSRIRKEIVEKKHNLS